MNKFLIATDGSPAAQAAVEAGVQLASEQGAAVLFLHVVEAVDVVAPSFGEIRVRDRVLPHPEEDEALVAAAAFAREHDVAYELRLVAGFEVDTILGVADEIAAELIAVGSNRHGVLETAFLGSVSKELLKRAQRPILVVHPVPAPVPTPA